MGNGVDTELHSSAGGSSGNSARGIADFDFGLTPEEEGRAARLQAESIIVDLTFSGPISCRSFTSDLERELREEWLRERNPVKLAISGTARTAEHAARGALPAYLRCWEMSGITAGSRPIELASLELALASFGAVRAQCGNLPWLREARGAADIRRAKVDGVHAVFGATQLIAGPGGNLVELLPDAHTMGLQMLQLTYNSVTVIGAGCTEKNDLGLTAYGAQLVALVNDLGIIVDTAHCGPRTTLDACERSRGPVVASHTAAKTLFPHPRGKTDEELAAIAGTGGVIGIVAVPAFLSPSSDVTIEAMLDHIDYVSRLVGWQHVAIGTDWPFPLPKSLLREVVEALKAETGFASQDIPDPESNLVGFDDYRDFPNITRGLVKRGYDDVEIQGILGENFLRVFEDVCG